MEILKDSARYARVMTKRAWRTTFTRDRRDYLARTAVLARKGLLFLGAGAAAVGIYHYRAYASGEQGLPQGYAWGALTHGQCADVAFASIHSVKPAEDVFLDMRPTVDGKPQPGVTFNLSGQAISIGSYEFCFEPGQLADVGIIFQARNGALLGEKEIYTKLIP